MGFGQGMGGSARWVWLQQREGCWGFDARLAGGLAGTWEGCWVFGRAKTKALDTRSRHPFSALVDLVGLVWLLEALAPVLEELYSVVFMLDGWR